MASVIGLECYDDFLAEQLQMEVLGENANRYSDGRDQDPAETPGHYQGQGGTECWILGAQIQFDWHELFPHHCTTYYSSSSHIRKTLPVSLRNGTL